MSKLLLLSVLSLLISTNLRAASNELPDSALGCGPVTNLSNFPTPPAFRQLFSAVRFTKAGKDFYFTPVTSLAAGFGGEVKEAPCDTGEALATQAVNNYCRKAFLLDCPNANGSGPCADNELTTNPLDPQFLFSKHKFRVSTGPGRSTVGAVPAQCKLSGEPGAAPDCCAIGLGVPAVIYIESTETSPNCGFKITKTGLGTFEIDDDVPCQLNSLFTFTTGGNVVGVDLQPQYLVQISRTCTAGTNSGNACVSNVDCPGGGTCPNGIVTFTLDPITGSNQVFTVDTTGKNDDTIADEVTTKMLATGLGLDAQTDRNARFSQNDEISRIDPIAKADKKARFAPGSRSRVANAKSKLVSVRVSGPLNMGIVAETSDFDLGIPTLNQWGMALVVILLLASSYWLLRRRRLSRE
ncbi:MAG TPA: IPTL-CTERM sorting domain-containing protein [Candidatus Polarisedimenticolia bacterium]|nr:IPTL-CTERM sorting domain-containing protein [Candidatus Polarisedimenticolia bacterium]